MADPSQQPIRIWIACSGIQLVDVKWAAKIKFSVQISDSEIMWHKLQHQHQDLAMLSSTWDPCIVPFDLYALCTMDELPMFFLEKQGIKSRFQMIELFSLPPVLICKWNFSS